MKDFLGVKDSMIDLVVQNANFMRNNIEENKELTPEQKKDNIDKLRERTQKKLKALLLSNSKLELMEKGPYEFRR